MVARPLAGLQPEVVGVRLRVRLRRPHADVHEPGTVLKAGGHGPKYEAEVLPIKN
jgi:hypothetical protein